MVATLLIEPVSKAQVLRVLSNLDGRNSAYGPCPVPRPGTRRATTVRTSQGSCTSTLPPLIFSSDMSFVKPSQSLLTTDFAAP